MTSTRNTVSNLNGLRACWPFSRRFKSGGELNSLVGSALLINLSPSLPGTNTPQHGCIERDGNEKDNNHPDRQRISQAHINTDIAVHHKADQDGHEVNIALRKREGSGECTKCIG